MIDIVISVVSIAIYINLQTIIKFLIGRGVIQAQPVGCYRLIFTLVIIPLKILGIFTMKIQRTLENSIDVKCVKFLVSNLTYTSILIVICSVSREMDNYACYLFGKFYGNGFIVEDFDFVKLFSLVAISILYFVVYYGLVDTLVLSVFMGVGNPWITPIKTKASMYNLLIIPRWFKEAPLSVFICAILEYYYYYKFDGYVALNAFIPNDEIKSMMVISILFIFSVKLFYFITSKVLSVLPNLVKLPYIAVDAVMKEIYDAIVKTLIKYNNNL